MLVVVGLGNPGASYARNRHNIGFRVAAAYRELAGLERFVTTAGAEVARGRRRGRPLLLARPVEFMNCSGDVVVDLMRRERVQPDELLVVVDDVYLPLARLRLRKQGGDGGHNGLRSIIDALGHTAFARLRFGVGGPPEGRDMKDWVLEDFTSGEEEQVGPAIDQAMRVIDTVLSQGIDVAMNRFNAPEADDEIPLTGASRSSDATREGGGAEDLRGGKQ